MIVYVPLNATHSSEILSIGAQVFREDDVSVLGDALHTACVSSCVASSCTKCTGRTEAPCTPWVQGVVALAPDGSVAAFAIFCRSSPISTRLSLYHQYYTSLFVQIGNATATATANANANTGSSLVELAFLAVHPRHQGAGIGAHLLSKCLGDLKTPSASASASAPPCWLVVDADNVGAQRLYERQGFIPLAPLLGTPYPSLIMFRFSGKIEIQVLSWIRAALLCNPISDDGNASNMCAMDTIDTMDTMDIDDTPFCDSHYNTPPRVSSPIRPVSVVSLNGGS